MPLGARVGSSDLTHAAAVRNAGFTESIPDLTPHHVLLLLNLCLHCSGVLTALEEERRTGTFWACAVRRCFVCMEKPAREVGSPWGVPWHQQPKYVQQRDDDDSE